MQSIQVNSHVSQIKLKQLKRRKKGIHRWNLDMNIWSLLKCASYYVILAPDQRSLHNIVFICFFFLLLITKTCNERQPHWQKRLLEGLSADCCQKKHLYSKLLKHAMRRAQVTIRKTNNGRKQKKKKRI